MPSKTKEARLEQKAYWENKLNQRLTLLNEKKTDPKKVPKDAAVRSMMAKIRETETRLKAIEGLEKKIEEMARVKAEKLAVPKNAKGKKQKLEEEKPAMSKRQQKKKKKAQDKEKSQG